LRAASLVVGAALLVLPTTGWTDDAPSAGSEVVATAGSAPVAPSQKADANLTRWLEQAPPVATIGQDYTDGVIQDAAPRKIHGEVGFGVGTGGYRDAYGAVALPIGKASELDVAIEDTHLSKPWKYERRSLAVNLAIGGAAAPSNCDSAIRVGDHFVEPLWATRIRGSALTGDPGCISAELPRR
jgi:hypothetical protein